MGTRTQRPALANMSQNTPSATTTPQKAAGAGPATNPNAGHTTLKGTAHNDAQLGMPGVANDVKTLWSDMLDFFRKFTDDSSQPSASKRNTARSAANSKKTKKHKKHKQAQKTSHGKAAARGAATHASKASPSQTAHCGAESSPLSPRKRPQANLRRDVVKAQAKRSTAASAARTVRGKSKASLKGKPGPMLTPDRNGELVEKIGLLQLRPGESAELQDLSSQPKHSPIADDGIKWESAEQRRLELRRFYRLSPLKPKQRRERLA